MQIDEQHIAEPVLVVLDVTATDGETAHARLDGLQQQWATSGVTSVWHVPGQEGVRARVYADIRARACLALQISRPGVVRTRLGHLLAELHSFRTCGALWRR
ncbi:DUF6207 family protein [Streptomyces sp. NPDC056503]|uniref:DUF6207 family protein n=1 Tax=Streptomyces sp. NPDC056503 TaxID=3345842 RepID=UPI003695E66D